MEILHVSASTVCFKCHEGRYYDWTKKGYYLPETDTKQCNKCGHICPAYISKGDVVVDDLAVVQEEIPISIKPFDISIDEAIEKFRCAKEYTKKYFHTFVDENDFGYQTLYGFRFENTMEREARRIDDLSDELVEVNKQQAARQLRYARYLVLKEKFNGQK